MPAPVGRHGEVQAQLCVQVSCRLRLFRVYLVRVEGLFTCFFFVLLGTRVRDEGLAPLRPSLLPPAFRVSGLS